MSVNRFQMERRGSGSSATAGGSLQQRGSLSGAHRQPGTTQTGAIRLPHPLEGRSEASREGTVGPSGRTSGVQVLQEQQVAIQSPFLGCLGEGRLSSAAQSHVRDMWGDGWGGAHPEVLSPEAHLHAGAIDGAGWRRAEAPGEVGEECDGTAITCLLCKRGI